MPFLSLGSRGLVEAKRQEARERKGCSGHSILRAGSGSEGWVSCEWWPQKSTEWVTEIRELVFPKTCPCMHQVCPVAQVEMAIYIGPDWSRGLSDMIPLVSLSPPGAINSPGD